MLGESGYVHDPFGSDHEGDELMRKPNRERGAVSIEFLLSILAILFTMFWMWEIVMALYAGNVFADAAKVGVRYAISHVKYGSTQVETFTGCPYSANPQCAT